MAEQELLIGCRGWDHDGWVPGFYPSELPDDWRFCFYSNQHRSVLVTEHELADVDVEQVSGWRDDCDEGFRFVFDLTPALLASSARPWPAWEAVLAPLRERTAGFLVSGLQGRRLGLLAAGSFPGTCVWCDDPGDGMEDEAMPGPGWGVVWRPQNQKAPSRSDVPVLALVGSLELPRLRRVLEVLAKVVAGTGYAALFFDDERHGHASAREARLLAELMGVL